MSDTNDGDQTVYKRRDYGPPASYEVTWLSGHVETINAHQVSWPGTALFGSSPRDPWVRFHADVDGQWRLVLQARETDLRSIRDVTSAERLTGGGV